MIQLQGKDYVTFRELLEYAHEKGLESVTNEVVQIPDQTNEYMAVVKATVTISGQVYSAYGDASPKSVNKMIAPHILRMAETRAIGRAFRVGLNIGVVMREELADADGKGKDEPEPNPASPKQLNYIKVLLNKKEFKDKYNLWEKATELLNNKDIQTTENASALLNALNKLPDKATDKDILTALLVDIERLENDYYKAVNHRENGREKYIEGYPDDGKDLSKYSLNILRQYADELANKDKQALKAS